MIYSCEEDEGVSFEELKKKYNLIYTKWIDLVDINKALKRIYKKFRIEKSLEKRNYD